MRVLHVAETIKGGIASYLDESIPSQIDRFGVDNVRVIVPEGHRSELRSIPDSACLTFPRNISSRKLGLLSLARAYRSALRNFQPNIVHAHSTFAGVVCRVLPISPATKIVYCAHGWAFARETGAMYNRIIGLIERFLSHKAEAIICLSERDRGLAIKNGIQIEKLHVIPNGIGDIIPINTDNNVSPAWRNGKIRVLFVGRFDFQKGYDIFLAALARLTETHHAIAIGMPVVDELETVDLPSNVENLGWQSRTNIHDFMQSANVVALPSRWEGAPITVLEAMRAGTAVLGTSVGAIPEQIEHKRSGLIIPSNDADALASALASHTAQEFKFFGAEARRRYQALFSSATMNSATQRLYELSASDRCVPTKPLCEPSATNESQRTKLDGPTALRKESRG